MEIEELTQQQERHIKNKGESIVKETEEIVTQSTQSSKTIYMITSATTTTIPPPKWVKSLEIATSSFENVDNSIKFGQTIDNGDEQSSESHLRPYIIKKKHRESSSSMINDHSRLKPNKGVAVNIIDYSGLEQQQPRKRPYSIDESNERQFEVSKEKSEEDETQMLVSKTKLTATIEKQQFSGPCGSACSYKGIIILKKFLN